MTGPTQVAQAVQFFDTVAPGESLTFQTFDDDADRKARSLAQILHGTVESCASSLHALNKRGAGVFWMVNHGDGKGRSTENVTRVRALFLDLDGAPLQAVLAAGAEPHAVVESSPGRWHVYWRVSGCSLAQFPPAQKALAAKFGGDRTVHDLPRVLRLPGFQHRKGEPFTSSIVSLEDMPPYAFDDLVQRLGLNLDKPPKPAERIDPTTGEITSKVTEGGRHAYLCRRLADLNFRGIPEAGIRAALHQINAEECDPPEDVAEVDAVVSDWLKRYRSQHGRDLEPAGWADPQSPEDFGDIANGKRFARKFRGLFLYVHAIKRWLRWDAMRWADCGNGEALKAAGLIAQDALDDAHAALKADPTEKAKGNHSQALSVHRNVRRLEAMLTVAAVQDGMSIANPGLLDADPWLLGVRNGVVNLRTGTLLQPDPSMLISRQAGAAFEPNARCDRWLKLLQEVFCGNAELIEFVRRAVGYSLTGLVDEEIAFLLFGDGANGKSVIANILHGVFGEYAVTVRACLLARDGKGGSSDAEREKAKLPGARLALINEVGLSDVFDDQRMKELNSRERISARMLYGESFEFLPTHKIWLRGNHAPGVLDSGDAFWRRIALIRFERKFAPHERVADLDRRILESEREGVLAWAVQGCLEWQRDGLRIPQSVRAAGDDYRRDTDQLGEWLEDQCRSAPGVSTPVSQLFDSYASFLQQGHMRPPSRVAFSRQLKQRGYKLARNRQARLVEGLALAASEGWVDDSDDDL